MGLPVSFFLLSVSLSVYSERLAVILGLITLVTALAVFFTCRTGMGLLKRVGLSRITQSRAYRAFNRYHSYYWGLLGLVLVIHLMSAIMHLGFNNSGDPDAYLHRYSVIFGLTALLALLVLAFSCRGISALLKLFSEKKVQNIRFLGFLYRFHNYYWMLFLVLIAAHFTAGFLHSGWWPS
jgi:hypothetical protein